jgi:guanylate kinase
VHGNLYGTPKLPVLDMLEAGKDVLFDIDWQGARQMSEKVPADLVRVFILPPSADALEERLKRRAQDGPEVVARRLAAASAEIGHWAEYDYVIVNADVAASLAGLLSILAAERLRRARQPGLQDFVHQLQGGL